MQNYTFFYKQQLFLRIFFHFSMSPYKKIASPVDFSPSTPRSHLRGWSTEALSLTPRYPPSIIKVF